MRTIHVLQEAGADKVIHLSIPVDEANRRYQLVIVVEPEHTVTPTSPPEDRGWPPGFFEQTAGRWQGDLEIEPEGDFEEREPL